MAEEAAKLTLAEAREKVANMQARLSGMRERMDESIDKVFSTVEVAGGAAVVGMINGYNGGPAKIAGVNIGLAMGVAGHLVAGLSGSRHSSHIANIANGALAAYSYEKGQEIGKKIKEKKDKGESIFSGEGDEPQQLPPRQAANPYAGNGVIVHQSPQLAAAR